MKGRVLFGRFRWSDEPKTPLGKADARTVQATWQRLGQPIDTFTPAECGRYFRNSGYASI